MMAQWHRCKKLSPQALLLFRLGDFYEAFYEDAALLSKELKVTLTQRQDIPMAGIPVHTSEFYIDKLVGKGFRVAIAEQMEDPKLSKGLVKREIVRILTPGTLSSSSAHNFLSCIVQVGELFGLAILDITTADFKAFEFESVKELLDELHRLEPKEILVSEKCKCIDSLHELKALVIQKENCHFEYQHTAGVLLRHFSVHNLDGFGLRSKVAAINAAGAILHYVQEELHLPVHHIKSLSTENLAHTMQIDPSTERHLEIFSSSQMDKGALTLLKVLDHTQTPMGGRLLKLWLMHPLLDVEEIEKRQDAIAALVETDALRSHLKQVHDLHRLLIRIETASATPRDLVALSSSLEQVQPLLDLLGAFQGGLLGQIREDLKDVSPLVSLLKTALVESPPLHLKEGGVFREGFHEKLDALLHLKQESHSWIAHYQAQLREATQIKTLKVGYTGVFGYYIEVSKGQSGKMGESFQRKQTLVNAERFTTSELKEFEYKMLHCEEQAAALEQELFTHLREQINSQSKTLHQIAEAIALLDLLCSLSWVAKTHAYVRPRVDTSRIFDIEQGRHPIVETSLGTQAYIPNDLFLDGEKELLHIITGPNMAGKSTFIRQAALFAILAQIGSFVPAKRAHIGIIDKVFSRIGASDDLSRGQSTFMVEMTETANILNNATSQSLVILDEIGRGTSTYDGIAIAWAVAEYLLTQKGKQAKTLFATHYWELTKLEDQLTGAVNYNVAVHESEKGIVFLRKIVKGGTDKSYGIHVAKLAGLPHAVIKRAQEMLKQLVSDCKNPPAYLRPDLPAGHSAERVGIFEQAVKREHEALQDKEPSFVKELKTLDLDHLTPMQALELLMKWKNTYAI